MPYIYDLLQDPVSKEEWKNLVKRTIHRYWESKIGLEAESKSSVKYLSKCLSVGKVHNIWKDADTDTLNVKKAGVKARLVSGTYLLESVKAKYNNTTDLCSLCGQDKEDMCHFLLECPVLDRGDYQWRI